MNSSPDVKSHDQLLHYQLGASLGEGGFGQVYQAWDTKLHRHVAIKYLKNVTVGVDLTREARLAASLQHAAFVKIHALEQTEDSQAIVMELVPGRTLRQILDLEAPGIATVLEMVRQVAQAMQEAHAAGLVHGDLKPSNLMQEPGGVVRILDFGLATQADRDATTSLVQADPQGTIAYMAPEVLTGAKLKASADIYALGVILYELLTARRPFSHLTGLALAAALIQSDSDQWPWPDHLPLSLRELVRAATARSLDKRIASMEEFGHRCTQLLELDPVSLHSASLNLAMLKLDPRFQQSSVSPTAWLSVFRPTRKKVISLALLISLVGVWYSQPYWSQVGESFKTYSEAQEMKSGLAALAQADRPDQLAQAEKHFTKILAHSPENAAALASLSLLYSVRYQSNVQDVMWLNKAAEYAQKSLSLNDFLALSHIANAKVLALRENFALALSDVDRALALDPNSVFAWQIKIDVLLHAQRMEEAQDLAQQALQKFAREPVFFVLLGQIKESKGDLVAAEELYGRSIQLKPDATQGYRAYAQLLARQNRSEEAAQILQQGLKVRASAGLSGYLGEILFARGDYVGAATAFEGAVSEEAGNVADYLAWARLAEALSWIPGRTEATRNAYTKALDLLKTKLGESPQNAQNADFVSRLGLYAAKLGDQAAVQSYVQKALSLAPENPEILYRAGVCFEMLGQRDAAISAINKARQLGFAMKIIESDPELLSLRRDAKYLRPAS